MNMDQKRVTAIVVTYNSKEHVGTALTALAEAHQCGMLDCVVVDNASRDDSAAFVAAGHPWVRLVRSGTNLGFGAGCNRALQYVNTPYVLFLNPDACMDVESVTALVRFLEEHPDAGIAAPLIHDTRGELATLPVVFPSPLRLLSDAIGFRRWGWEGGQLCMERGGSPARIAWARGAAFMARTKTVDALNGFDEAFFLYFEEVDLCRRAQAAGWQTWAVGTALATHVGQASLAPGSELHHGCLVQPYYRSRYHYLCKHAGRAAALAVELCEPLLVTARECARRCLGRQPVRPLRSCLHAPAFRAPRVKPSNDGSAGTGTVQASPRKTEPGDTHHCEQPAVRDGNGTSK